MMGKYLFLLVCFISFDIYAVCYRVTGQVSVNPNNNQILIQSGATATNWPAGADGTNGSMGFPNVINAYQSSFQPLWSIFASSTAPFTQYGHSGGWPSTQVFFRCSPDTDVYEWFSTNTLNSESGQQMIDPVNHPGVFRHRWALVGMRLTNLASGEFFDNKWKSRLLEGLMIEAGGRGFKLVRAVDMTAVRVDMFITNSLGSGGGNDTGKHPNGQFYNYGPALGWVIVAGEGIDNGANVLGGQVYNQHRENWVGVVSVNTQVYLYRWPTCKIINHTPNVIFPSVTSSTLNAGGYVAGEINVNFVCETGSSGNAFVSGTADGNTAIGFLVSAQAAAQPISNTELKASGAMGGYSHLVDGNYGAPGVASGVGVKLLRDGVPMYWLSTQDSLRGTNAQNTGWMPVVGSNTNVVSMDAVNNVTYYNETFEVRLERLPGATATLGSFRADGQIIIQVQ